MIWWLLKQKNVLSVRTEKEEISKKQHLLFRSQKILFNCQPEAKYNIRQCLDITTDYTLRTITNEGLDGNIFHEISIKWLLDTL